MKLFLAIIFSLLFSFNCFAVDRCQSYIQEVRKQYEYYWGLNYPYWYGLGQLKQESGCRPDRTAFDGGMGIGQFMPATQKEIEKGIGKFNPYNAKEGIKANAYYMRKIHRSNWDGRLWLTYMFYNSGAGTMKKEFLRAGVLDFYKMRNVCKRKVLKLKNGSFLDLCEVGYDYPNQIWKFGQKYRIFEDKMLFW